MFDALQREINGAKAEMFALERALLSAEKAAAAPVIYEGKQWLSKS